MYPCVVQLNIKDKCIIQHRLNGRPFVAGSSAKSIIAASHCQSKVGTPAPPECKLYRGSGKRVGGSAVAKSSPVAPQAIV